MSILCTAFSNSKDGEFDPTSTDQHNDQYAYADFGEGGDEQEADEYGGANSFDVNDPPAPAAPGVERREPPALSDHLRDEPQPDPRHRTDVVYKKCPGAPKRYRNSYVHFFTHFVEQKKRQLGPDGLVSVFGA